MNPSDLPALPAEREAALLARVAELERERDSLSLENSDMEDTLDVLGSTCGSECERADKAERERDEALAALAGMRSFLQSLYAAMENNAAPFKPEFALDDTGHVTFSREIMLPLFDLLADTAPLASGWVPRDKLDAALAQVAMMHSAVAPAIYEATRQEAAESGRPIVPEPWEMRDEKFRAQFTKVIAKICAPGYVTTPEIEHDNWVRAYEEMGWKYGPTRDVEKKTHPDMVPYDQLGKAEREKDAIFLACCHVAREILASTAPAAEAFLREVRKEEADAIGCAIAEVFRQFCGWRDWQELPDFPSDAVSPTSCDWAADKLEDLIASALQARAALRAGGETNG